MTIAWRGILVPHLPRTSDEARGFLRNLTPISIAPDLRCKWCGYHAHPGERCL